MNLKIKNWIDNNISINLENKNIFVTGSNSGIGFELLKYCAYLKANLFILSRNIDKALIAKDLILKEYPNTKIKVIELDLSSIKSIDESFNEIKKYDCDIFVNNAGVYRLPLNYTKDNIEVTMATNFIGPYYLNNMLNEYFLSLKHKVTNIFTTSISSKNVKNDYDDFYSIKSNNLIKRYARSKAAINDMYFYFVDKYQNSNIIFSLVHPGISYTPLINKAYKSKLFNKISKLFMNIIFHTPEYAALNSLYAMNFNNSNMIGPSRFFEMKGFPKEVKFKRNINYIDTINKVEQIIESIKENKL